MKNDNATTLEFAAKTSTGGIIQRSLGKSSSRKWENENWEKGVEVHTFNKRPRTRRVVITADQAYKNDFSIFKMSERGSQKMEWDSLSDGHKKAFNEVLNTFENTEKIPHTAEHFAGGFSFAYSDEEVDLSAVCIASQGKLMLFYKETEV